MVELVLSLRFLMLIASLGALVGAVLMFTLGALKLLHAATRLVEGVVDPRTTTTDVMGATDAFLFGIVLIIFASTIALSFVLRHDASERLPPWMRVRSLRELKRTLIEVILVYLVVDAATDLASADEIVWSLLVKPAAIVAIAAALRLIGDDHADGLITGEQGAAAASFGRNEARGKEAP